MISPVTNDAIELFYLLSYILKPYPDERLNADLKTPSDSIKYTERLADAGVEPSVGSVDDSYDNALAETINGLYKAVA